jgi:hypothetical protein
MSRINDWTKEEIEFLLKQVNSMLNKNMPMENNVNLNKMKKQLETAIDDYRIQEHKGDWKNI